MDMKERVVRVVCAVILAAVLLFLAGVWIRWETKRQYGYYSEAYYVIEQEDTEGAE